MHGTDDTTALPHLDETVLATTRYLGALTVLDDESLAQPSVLPGWTRAHVIAHLSRNADAFTQVFTQAAAGGPAYMYTSNEDRETDIERTVERGFAALREDAHASSARFIEAAWAFDPGLRDAPYTRTPSDSDTFPVKTVGGRRRTEVEIHHSDLDVGYSPADWPYDFSLAMVKRRQDEMAALPQGCPSMVLSSTDVEGLWKFGEGPGPEIHGAAGDLAWWLVGRGGGRGLTSSTGELPTLGKWR